MNKKILTLLIIIAVLIAVIVYLKDSTSPNTVGVPTPTISVSQPNNPTLEMPSSTPIPTQQEDTSDKKQPTVSTPKPNTKVSSPLTIVGTVPPGWMFEGVFPVKLLDAQKNSIAQTQGKETTPGSWSSGNAVSFQATVDFTTTAKSGFVVLEKDNPSGLPENAGSFEIPVTF